jgi:integrase
MDPRSQPARLLDQVRNRIRLKHYSIRTEQAYVDWIRGYIYFHGKRHPAAMGAPEIEAFLTDLAVARNVAAATQNQARSALLFLCKEILAIELPWLEGVQTAKASTRLPVVLTREEVAKVLDRLVGTASADRCAALRLGNAHHGGNAAPREGRRIHPRRNRRARRQGR